MKRIIIILIASLLLTGCTTQERAVYTSDVVDISRSGTQVCVVSHYDGREYTYTLHRVRRAKNAAVIEKTVLETDAFTITSAGNVWVVETPEAKVCIRW